jgi:hypothetical protein
MSLLLLFAGYSRAGSPVDPTAMQWPDETYMLWPDETYMLWPVYAWEPIDLSPLVLLDVENDLWSEADGEGTVVTVSGDVVQSVTNTGSNGGYLSKLTDSNGPKLRFSGGTPYLEFNNTANQRALTTALISAPSGSMTIWMFCRHDHTTAGQLAGTLWTTAGDSNGASGGMGAIAIDRDYQWALGYDSADGIVSSLRPPLFTDNKWHLCVWRRTAGSPSTWDVYLDNQLISTGTTATTATVARYGICGPMYGIGFKGDVVASGMIRTALSSEEITQLWEYYKTSSLITQDNTKGLIVLGDSVSTWLQASLLTDGAWLMPRGLVWQYGSYLQTNNSLGRFYNNSWGGKKTSNHISEAGRIAGWANTFTNSVDFIISTGVNGINPAGDNLTAAQEYANMLTLKNTVSPLVNVGITQRWWLVTPQDGNPAVYVSPYESRLVALRALITGNTDGFRVIDTSGVPTGYLWGTPGRTDTLFYGDPSNPNRDGLHPLASGMDNLAPVYYTNIGSVM